ncbi:hypothetical protein HC931_04890 [Candidatus Gracilibacteria bacterium]|nr:hypothetical protein [Candidatus Gracilibacteria bacterium]NJM89599.1 hypothetical protein [Hydrococcus sp. RU_2_2]NJP19635.1 hypothetical protein [Hydrococcus sp. CRU_1_1]
MSFTVAQTSLAPRWELLRRGRGAEAFSGTLEVRPQWLPNLHQRQN